LSGINFLLRRNFPGPCVVGFTTTQGRKIENTISAVFLKILQQHFLHKILFSFYLLSQLFSCSAINKIPEASHTHIIESVPLYPQDTYQCGPASLAGVLNYWGVLVTSDDIAREIFSESARGTLTIDIVLYAQMKGLTATQYKGNMDNLKKNIDSDYPIIVLVDYGISLYQANHFMVVVGYNEHGVIVNSGKNKHEFISEKDFMKAWRKTKFWTLLIKPE
jgi:hypothetical protein